MVSEEIQELSTDVIASADELITKAKETVDTTSGLVSTRTWVPAPEASTRTLNAIQDRLMKTGQQGIDFGWPTITKHLGFLRPTKLWVICARPAMGKSTLANQLAYIAAKQGVGTGFIGLEMDVEEHTERTLVQLSGVNAMDVRDGRLTKHQQMELGRFADYYDTLPMWVEYAPGLTMNRLRGMAYQLRAEAAAKGFPLGLLIVDYLQLMGGMANGQSKNDFYGDITRACKQLAGELKISIVMLSQLNRNLESRTDKRPMMSDLRESGAIEQDADVIIGIDRPEVWAANDRPGEADIVIMKARGGMTGVIAVQFHGATLTFGDEVAGRAPM
jgi:replicative DNA helicase